MRILIYCPVVTDSRIDYNWLYGRDIVRGLMKLEPDWEFISCTGNTTKDKLYSGIDVYLRPTRHDGMPIMVQEAQALGIPVVWSYSNGYYIEPTIEGIYSELKFIEKSLCKKDSGRTVLF